MGGAFFVEGTEGTDAVVVAGRREGRPGDGQTRDLGERGADVVGGREEKRRAPNERPRSGREDPRGPDRSPSLVRPRPEPPPFVSSFPPFVLPLPLSSLVLVLVAKDGVPNDPVERGERRRDRATVPRERVAPGPRRRDSQRRRRRLRRRRRRERVQETRASRSEPIRKRPSSFARTFETPPRRLKRRRLAVQREDPARDAPPPVNDRRGAPRRRRDGIGLAPETHACAAPPSSAVAAGRDARRRRRRVRARRERRLEPPSRRQSGLRPPRSFVRHRLPLRLRLRPSASARRIARGAARAVFAATHAARRASSPRGRMPRRARTATSAPTRAASARATTDRTRATSGAGGGGRLFRGLVRLPTLKRAAVSVERAWFASEGEGRRRARGLELVVRLAARLRGGRSARAEGPAAASARSAGAAARLRASADSSRASRASSVAEKDAETRLAAARASARTRGGSTRGEPIRGRPPSSEETRANRASPPGDPPPRSRRTWSAARARATRAPLARLAAVASARASASARADDRSTATRPASNPRGAVIRAIGGDDRRAQPAAAGADRRADGLGRPGAARARRRARRAATPRRMSGGARSREVHVRWRTRGGGRPSARREQGSSSSSSRSPGVRRSEGARGTLAPPTSLVGVLFCCFERARRVASPRARLAGRSRRVFFAATQSTPRHPPSSRMGRRSGRLFAHPWPGSRSSQ